MWNYQWKRDIALQKTLRRNSRQFFSFPQFPTDILGSQFDEAHKEPQQEPEEESEEEQEPVQRSDSAKGKGVAPSVAAHSPIRLIGCENEASDEEVQIVEEKSSKGKTRMSDILKTARRMFGLRSASKF